LPDGRQEAGIAPAGSGMQFLLAFLDSPLAFSTHLFSDPWAAVAVSAWSSFPNRLPKN